MDEMVGSWQSRGFRTALARQTAEDLKKHQRVAAISASHIWLRFMPRKSRVIDVLIAATVAYFWL